jgi:penicillin-binding protein 2
MQFRVILLRIISLLVFVALLARLQQLQFGQGAQSSRKLIDKITTRLDYVPPQRGEIFASDGKTLLAAAEPTSIVGIRAELLPSARSKPLERDSVFLHLSLVLPFTDTFTISPTTVLQTNPAFASAVYSITNVLPADTSFAPHRAITVTVPPGRQMAALELSRIYSDVVDLQPGVEQALAKADLPPYLVVPIASNVPREVAFALRENSAILPGVKVIEGFRRSYPMSGQIPSLSHILGYTGRINAEEFAALNPADPDEGPRNYLENDIVGKDGLEYEYEAVLRGTMGINQIDVDAFQRTVGEPTVVRSLENGKNITLNIDVDLQRASEQILTKWLQIADGRRVALAAKNDATGQKIARYKPITKGVIIVMDVNSGAVLASVSLPAYDNSLFTRPVVTQAEADRVFQNPDTPLLNRAINGKYPPGSTFKQFTAAAGLRNGVITPETRFFDPGVLVVKNEFNEAVTNQYPNSGRAPHGLINVSDALKVSSNVFFNIVGGGTEYVTNLKPTDPQLPNGLGIDRFYTMLVDDYGFNKPTGIDLPGESKGLIPNKDWKAKELSRTWGIGDTYIAAIGQGDVAVTPIQLLRGTVATATRGTVYRPQVVKSIASLDDSEVITLTPIIDHSIAMDPAYWSVIREGMRRSVRDPDAYNRRANANNKPAGNLLGDIDAFDLAGKTGTAEYEENGVLRSHSWFVGFAPFDQPKVAVLALLEGTGDLGDGSGTLALPAVVDVLRAYFKQPVPDINGNLPPPPAAQPAGN